MASMKNGKWKLWFKLMKLRGRIFYMRYAKIMILALAEMIAEWFYTNKNRRG